jgi:membrane protein implicated in regulation of membrane protease activity
MLIPWRCSSRSCSLSSSCPGRGTWPRFGGLAVETVELTWGLSLAGRWEPKTGAEAMIGEEAEVVTACRPLGEVRVQGELWRARCDEGADVGESVRIERIDGLTLVVRPI